MFRAHFDADRAMRNAIAIVIVMRDHEKTGYKTLMSIASQTP